MKKRYKALQNKQRHIYLDGGGIATVTGKPSKELIAALTKMVTLAKNLKSPY